MGGGSERGAGWCRGVGEAGSGWEGAQLCGDDGDGSQGHDELLHGDCGEAQPCECGHCDDLLETCDPEPLGTCADLPGVLPCDLPPWSQSLDPGPGCTDVEADEADEAASSSVHVCHDCVLH